MEALDQLAKFLKKELCQTLLNQGHTASERLLRSIDVAVLQTLSGFEIVGQAILYAKFVDRGRRAGARGVPVDALIEWIRQKRIQIAGMSERSQAFMLQASIRRKGIPPSRFITQTLDDPEGVIDRRINEACGAWVDVYIEKIFNELKK